MSEPSETKAQLKAVCMILGDPDLSDTEKVLWTVEWHRAETAALRAVIRGDCENETLIEREALKVLTSAQVHGDSYGVPGPVGIVELLVKEVITLRAENEQMKHKNHKSSTHPLDPSPFYGSSDWRMTDETNGHKWGFWKNDKFQCCRICGYVRRADDKNKPCRGRPKLRL